MNMISPNVVARGEKRQQVSVEEFKRWLMKFDANNDRRISRSELREAIRSRGAWFMTTWKASRGIKEADVNGDGFIDEKELDNLVGFAERTMGFKFY